MSKDRKILLGFIAVWTTINLLQAGFTELAHDEAYYWTWSLFPDWGYLEHPPLVAVFIKIGYALFGSELGVRFVTVLASSTVLYLVYNQLVKKDVWLYIAIVSSIFLIHMGSFLTAPDSPLFLFTALFYILFLKYLEKDSWKLALLLMLIVAAMMYSKYHAILVIAFAVLLNWRIMRRPSFWVLTLGGILLYGPHLYWLFSSGSSGMDYALSDRFDHPWTIGVTGNYIIGQLGATGPLVGILLLFAAIKGKTTINAHRTLKWIMICVFGFFLLWSFRGEIQGNWTATAIIPLIVVGHAYITERKKFRRWVMYLAIPSVVLLGALRIQLTYDFMPLPKHVTRVHEFHGWDDYADEVKVLAKGHNMMATNYQIASKLWFYTGDTCVALNANNRPNQFDIWNIDNQWRGEAAFILHAYLMGPADTIQTPDGPTEYMLCEDFYNLKNVEVEIIPGRTVYTDKEKTTVKVRVTPPADGVIPGASSKIPVYVAFNIHRRGEAKSLKWNTYHFRFTEDINEEIVVDCPIRMHWGPGEYDLYAWICHDQVMSWKRSEKVEFRIE